MISPSNLHEFLHTNNEQIKEIIQSIKHIQNNECTDTYASIYMS